MDILTVIVVLALVGFVTWIVVTYVPMPPLIKRVLVVFVAVVLVLWLVRTVFGISTTIPVR